MNDTPDSALQAFAQEVARHEDLQYGIALFFEGLTLLFAGQDDVLETHRKLFRNIIETGNATLERARDLLESARTDDTLLPRLAQFAFRPGEGHPDPEALSARARVLAALYEELFPARPRDQALTPEETLRLMDAASQRVGSG